MTDDHGRNVSCRRAIPVTCTQHGGTPGFTNLVITQRDGDIELDPHVDRGCVLLLDETGARALSRALQELLG